MRRFLGVLFVAIVILASFSFSNLPLSTKFAGIYKGTQASYKLNGVNVQSMNFKFVVSVTNNNVTMTQTPAGTVESGAVDEETETESDVAPADNAENVIRFKGTYKLSHDGQSYKLVCNMVELPKKLSNPVYTLIINKNTFTGRCIPALTGEPEFEIAKAGYVKKVGIPEKVAADCSGLEKDLEDFERDRYSKFNPPVECKSIQVKHLNNCFYELNAVVVDPVNNKTRNVKLKYKFAKGNWEISK